MKKHSKKKDNKKSSLFDLEQLLLQSESDQIGNSPQYYDYLNPMEPEHVAVEDTASDPPFVLMILSDGDMILMDLDTCFEEIEWFGDSEIIEPVPDSNHLYFTCPETSLIHTDHGKYLVGPAVVMRYRADGEQESLRWSDVYSIWKGLSERTRILTVTNKQTIPNAVCIS